MAPKVFDVYSQLTFYGAYHTNKLNVLIHVICVPWILWSFQVILTSVPLPEIFPKFHYALNDYLVFDMNFPLVFSVFYLAYYFVLEPFAALLYTPQMVLSVLTATACGYRQDAVMLGGVVNGICWILQFIGHGVAEKRAPALLDNVAGALVLAPFFVHLEILFKLGYRPDMHRRLLNDIGKEVTRLRKIDGDKKRAAQAKKE